MGHKKFDELQYNEDDNAKYQVIDYLTSKGFKAWVNPDQYGIDVLAEKMGLSCRFEVEVKHNWETNNFPFDTVHFSARKLKFVEDNTWFVMLNSPRTQSLFVSNDVLLKSPIVVKNTKYTSNERFISIRKVDCEFRSLLRLSNPYNS